MQLRGRLPDEKMREVAHSFAQAKFGTGNVYTAARVVDDLPADWPLRVLTGIEALGVLNSGVVRITAESIALTGKSGNPDASDLTARLFADKLGGEQSFEIDVTYVEALDPDRGPAHGGGMRSADRADRAAEQDQLRAGLRHNRCLGAERHG